MLVVIVGSKLVSKKIPGALIAVIGAIALSWYLDLGQHVHVLGAVPSGLPHIGLPQVDWSWGLLSSLAPTAFAMFVVILAQSAATSRAYAARYNERFSEDTDLVGLAAANIGAGLSGTFVVNGSPTKTQMVDSAGGRTQLSLLITTAIVLLVLLFFTGPLAYMPEAVLSAVVFLIGIDLIDLAGMQKIYRERRSEFWVALITTLMVVFVGVEQGIILAIVLSLIDHTRRGYRPKNAVLVPDESGVLRPQPVTSGAQALPGWSSTALRTACITPIPSSFPRRSRGLPTAPNRRCAGSASTARRSTTWTSLPPRPCAHCSPSSRTRGYA